MNLQLVYPAKRTEGHKREDLQGIPNKNGKFSGYFLLALLESKGVVSEKYACFTEETLSEVWVEKVATLSTRSWFTIEDTRKIESDEEFNEVLTFLRQKGILE